MNVDLQMYVIPCLNKFTLAHKTVTVMEICTQKFNVYTGSNQVANWALDFVVQEHMGEL